jgi:hypothetical protein
MLQLSFKKSRITAPSSSPTYLNYGILKFRNSNRLNIVNNPLKLIMTSDKLLFTVIRKQKFYDHHNINEIILNSYFTGIISNLKLSRNKSTIITVFSKKLKNFLIFLKYHWRFRFNFLMDLWAVDFSSRINRFELNYALLILKTVHLL